MPSAGRNPTSNCSPRRWSCTGLSVRTARTKRSTSGLWTRSKRPYLPLSTLPKEITDTLADVLADYSVRPARMLEPSAGVGVFVDSVLRHSPNADVMAFEKDLLTGTILRHLYPDQKMRTCGFEKIEKPFNNYFDLAVSNIPFGDIAVFDPEFQRSDSFGRRSAQKAIHNYFFPQRAGCRA